MKTILIGIMWGLFAAYLVNLDVDNTVQVVGTLVFIACAGGLLWKGAR
jgi:hypothetical protein